MSDAPAPEYVLWSYTPSLPGNVIATLAFAILALLHTYKLLKNRTWFCIPLVVGALFEVIGYAARAAAHGDTESLGPYITQSLLILIAPILFAASVYMTLGRLMLRTQSTSYSIIRAKWVTKMFVTADVLCFVIQCGGAGMLTQAKDAAAFKRGENVILGGLILQILVFAVFFVVAGIWHRRLSAIPTAVAAEVRWEKHVWLLYSASVCITVRNFCRVIEYAMGKVSLRSRVLDFSMGTDR